jgi:uncharacterized membrane protein YhhN
VKTVLYLIPVLVVSVIFLIRAELLKRRKQIYIIKPFATLVVIAMAFASFLEIQQNLTYTIGILFALFFSLGGDIALMFQEKQKAFKAGLGLFVLAHVAYSVIFLILGSFSSWDALLAVLLVMAGVVFYRLIQPGLGTLKYPVIVYIVIISFMVSRAFSAFMSPVFSAQQALMLAVGALLFYFSDMVLAANRFWRPWRYHRINLVFYYSGQGLIALAASYFV